MGEQPTTRNRQRHAERIGAIALLVASLVAAIAGMSAASSSAAARAAGSVVTRTLPSNAMLLSMATDAAGTTRLLQDDGESPSSGLRLTTVAADGAITSEQLIPPTPAWASINAELLDGGDALIGMRSRPVGGTPSRTFLMERTAGAMSAPVAISAPSKRGASEPWISASPTGAAAVAFEETRTDGTSRRRLMLRGVGGGRFRTPLTLPRRRFVQWSVTYGPSGDGAVVTSHNGIHPLTVNRVDRDGTLGRLIAIDDRPVDAVMVAFDVAANGTIGIAWLKRTAHYSRWDLLVTTIPPGRSTPRTARILATERRVDDAAVDAAWAAGHLLVAVAFGTPAAGATTGEVVRVYDASSGQPREVVLRERPGRDAQDVALFGRADGTVDLVWGRIGPGDDEVLVAHRTPQGAWSSPTVIGRGESLRQDFVVPRPTGGLSAYLQFEAALGEELPPAELASVDP